MRFAEAPFYVREKDGPRMGEHEIRQREGTGNSREMGMCPCAKRCGGCRYMGRDYGEQLREKERRLKKLLAPYGQVEAFFGMEDPCFYRNKVHAVFGEDKRHEPISGIYQEGTHVIVPTDRCLIEDQQADRIIVSVRRLLKSFKIRPYNEDTGYGLLRHVLVRTARATGQIMVVLVLASPVMPSRNHFVKALRELHPEITTVVANINGRGTSMVLGEREQVLYGRGYIEDKLCGRVFRISSRSFYQVNPVQTEVLYGKALEYAALTGTETVVDAYCGIGTIGILAGSRAGRVIGVELNRDAVRDARENARQNGVGNIRFFQGDAGRFLVDMARQGARADAVLLDPPRSGSSRAFLNSLVRLSPSRVVYISCNPETLARDLKYLTGQGYELKRAAGVDMFPFTDSIEAVCCLSGPARSS